MTSVCHDPTRSGSSAPGQATETLYLSLSEIGTLCVKAARGAGFDWGLAEEAGHAVVWLARAGLPATAMFSAFLEAGPLHSPRPAPIRWCGAGALCPVRTGVSLQEFAQLAEGSADTGLRLVNVAFPGLLLPFAARAALFLGASLRIEWPGAMSLLPLLHPAALPPGHWCADSGVDITLMPAATDEGLAPVGHDPPVQHASHHGAISLSVWRHLETLALRTTVPASARSRAGAGSAGSDND
jgi:hypothetical protein